jgi:superfamily II helicase
MENLKSISLKKFIKLLTLFQIISKGFCNLRLFELIEASRTIMENCIERKNLNNVKWFCLKNYMIRKLPKKLFNYLQIQVLDLAQCQNLEKIPSSIDQLNALQEFDLTRCWKL